MPTSPSAGPDTYRAIFEAAPIGLGVADLDGRLLMFNSAMTQPGGYTREDIIAIGNVARLYCHDAERERVLAIAQEKGHVWRHEVQFRRKDGSCYDALVSLTSVEFEGRRCWLAAVEDISDRKRAEQQQRQLQAQLTQAQKMEAVGQMTAGIAHDFNNVLSVIGASAQLLERAVASDHAAAEDLAELSRAAARGIAMVRKLLGYSRHTELRRHDTDLTPLVHELRGMLQRLVPERIRLQLGGEPESRAPVDASAVEQIVVNLVTNARDAISAGGEISVQVRPVQVRQGDPTPAWLPAAAYVRLTVTDTGSGMDEATRARAFQPFFTTKATGAGTGLGLAMVFGLTKQHGGFVDIDSAPGRGTTVHVYFPRTPSAPAATRDRELRTRSG
jgi:PAS domain S-box-containing protein